jgi:DNA-binding MarR family transcriptional regulator
MILTLYDSAMKKESPVLDSPVEAPLTQDLGWMLGTLLRAYAKAVDEVLGDLPGGPRGYQVLSCAVHGASQNQRAIADQLGVDRTVLTYLIDDLEGAGLIERRLDPSDRRRNLLTATDAGRIRWQLFEENLRHVEDRLLGALAPEERRTFRAQMHRVAASAQVGACLDDVCDVVNELRGSATSKAR